MALVHTLVGFALKIGVLERPNFCEECSRVSFVVAHHDDYVNPLDVRWLCRPCHGNWHAEHGPGLNRDFAGFDAVGQRLPSRIRSLIGEMRDLRINGWTLQSIGEKYGCTREYVRRFVGDIKKATQMSLVKEKMQEIVSLRNDGKTIIEIGEILGLSEHAIRAFDIPSRKVIIPHGTINSYSGGCRCLLCRKANATKTKEYYRLRRSNGLCVACGSPSKNWFCKECYLKNKGHKTTNDSFPSKGNSVTSHHEHNLYTANSCR